MPMRAEIRDGYGALFDTEDLTATATAQPGLRPANDLE